MRQVRAKLLHHLTCSKNVCQIFSVLFQMPYVHLFTDGTVFFSKLYCWKYKSLCIKLLRFFFLSWLLLALLKPFRLFWNERKWVVFKQFCNGALLILEIWTAEIGAHKKGYGNVQAHIFAGLFNLLTPAQQQISRGLTTFFSPHSGLKIEK